MQMAFSKPATISLYRALLKNSLNCANYNFREHAKRRVKGEFAVSRNLSGSEAEHKYGWGLEQLEILKRQAVISHLYSKDTSVVASLKKARK